MSLSQFIAICNTVESPLSPSFVDCVFRLRPCVLFHFAKKKKVKKSNWFPTALLHLKEVASNALAAKSQEQLSTTPITTTKSTIFLSVYFQQHKKKEQKETKTKQKQNKNTKKKKNSSNTKSVSLKRMHPLVSVFISFIMKSRVCMYVEERRKVRNA